MPQELTKPQKVRKLALFYFAASDDEHDDVNPFPTTQAGIDNFLASNVGDLRWGQDDQVRRRSKERFAFTFSRLLDTQGIGLTSFDALAVIEKDDQTNFKAAEKWAAKATFPARHS